MSHPRGDCMKLILTITLFLCVLTAAFCYSSYSDTQPFVLDTTPPEVTLIAPNGGENWYIGDTNNILWSATDTNITDNPVSLWYTLTGGTTYVSIEEMIQNSGSYPWPIPSQQSNNARIRIRVTDSFGNYTQKSSTGYFRITYVPPAIPESLVVDISNNIDAVLNWLPVTETIYQTPIIPDGYIVLYNETPYEDEHYFYFLARTYGTSYTHQDVAEFREQMFYKVKAYKNYTRESNDLLEILSRRAAKERILWKDALRILAEGGF
jgi:hypothetical protein